MHRQTQRQQGEPQTGCGDQLGMRHADAPLDDGVYLMFILCIYLIPKIKILPLCPLGYRYTISVWPC